MKTTMLTLVALVAAITFAPTTAQAQVEGPWCAVYELGEGSVGKKCDFMTFEACLKEITGGNRGFCNNNPYWTGGAAAPAPGAGLARKRSRR